MDKLFIFTWFIKKENEQSRCRKMADVFNYNYAWIKF